MSLMIDEYEEKILMLLHVVEVIIDGYAVILSSGKS